jgi:hypothetical protein
MATSSDNQIRAMDNVPKYAEIKVQRQPDAVATCVGCGSVQCNQVKGAQQRQ